MIFLGNPTEDPHGDPIPNAKGIFKIDKQLLSELAINQQGICVGVSTSSDFKVLRQTRDCARFSDCHLSNKALIYH
jgi:hypothetical protein